MVCTFLGQNKRKACGPKCFEPYVHHIVFDRIYGGKFVNTVKSNFGTVLYFIVPYRTGTSLILCRFKQHDGNDNDGVHALFKLYAQ